MIGNKVAQYGWEDCPELIQAQVNSLVEAIKSQLKKNLRGIYLHGSLAMGCFNPDRSDIDLLVVTRRQIPVSIKRGLTEQLLICSNAPRPVEISFLQEADLVPWQYPTPYDWHYSESWRAQYQEDLQSGNWQRWGNKQQVDEDLAAHTAVTRARGLCLWGEPIAQSFPVVPSSDYLHSILSDLEWAKARIAQNPVYVILNLCRVYGYLQTGQIYSKDEAGAWAIQFLPGVYRPVAAAALAVYRGQGRVEELDEEQVRWFFEYVEEEINQP